MNSFGIYTMVSANVIKDQNYPTSVFSPKSL